MSIDLDQFQAAFFEESLETVDNMESYLLAIDSSDVDIDLINAVFRGAHSIKGCSATFSLNEITELVHAMETLLDQMRSDAGFVSQAKVDVLLRAIDMLRDLLLAGGKNTSHDIEYLNQILQNLELHITNDSYRTFGRSPGTLDHSMLEYLPVTSWDILFIPNREIFQSGNDPLRMISLLRDYGDITVETDTTALPALENSNPELCYLSWRIRLVGRTTINQLREVFEWVEDDCRVEISLLDSEQTAPALSPFIDKYSRVTRKKTPMNDDASSIRVSIDKVDAIINLVGELVITQSMLDQTGTELENGFTGSASVAKMRSGLEQLERNTRELQENIMRIRMLPISHLFNRVPRIVHDISRQLSKNVAIKMTGENTELDKTVLEKLSDPLVHLIRNAMDHGIEPADTRQAAGKPANGTVFLNACHKGGNIVVEIRDDGAGLDKAKILNAAREKRLLDKLDLQHDSQVYDLIFQPGFSTVKQVNNLSGRGVGMDVVRKNIKSLGGSIDVHTQPGVGTTFTIKLPLTLSILDGQLIKVRDETYVIPLVSIIESLLIDANKINLVAGKMEMYRLRQEYIPVIRMATIFNSWSTDTSLDGSLMVVVESEGRKAGLVVDELLGQQQVVIKSLESNFKSIQGLSGATILGDGTVALIVDASSLIGLTQNTDFTLDARPNLNHVTNAAA